MEDADLPLAAAFASATRERWLELVEAGLKGAPFSRLVSRTADGLEVQPLYTAADAPEGARLFAPGEVERPWQVRTLVAAADLAEANRQGLQDLENGAASLLLRYAAPGRRGLPAGADLGRVLDGVLTDLAPVALDAGFDGPAAAEALSAAAGRGPAAPLAFHLDPLSAYARSDPGDMRPSVGEAIAEAGAAAVRLAEPHPKATLFLASGVAVHEAGGSEAQELGFAAASALSYVRAAEAAGMDPVEALTRTVLGLAVDGRYFLSLAKLRAMHAIWARLTAACGRASPARIEARGSERMLARVDPWVNLIRGTAATFAAATGGAGAMVLQPFTEPLGAPTDFARRQARNIQLVLMEEAHLGRVADPAAGSWYVESLTERLARAGWEVMQEIERRGGAAAALEDGWLAGEVARARVALERDVATRRTGLIGVSEFPNLGEAPVEVGTVSPCSRSAPDPHRPSPDDAAMPLPSIRLSEPFERLRARASAAAPPPNAFLVELPVLTDEDARAAAARVSFARALLAAGGIAVEVGSLEQANGRGVVVLCGSDAVYARRGAETISALHAAGVGGVWIAGQVDVKGAAGNLFFGCDAPQLLGDLLAELDA